MISQETDNPNDISFVFTIDGSEVNLSNTEENQDLLNNIFVFNSDFIDEAIKTTNFSDNDVSGEVAIPLGSESNVVTQLKTSIGNDVNDRKKVYDELKDTKIVNYTKEILEQKKYKKGDINIWKEVILQNIVNDEFTFSKLEKPDGFDTCETQFESVSSLDEDSKIFAPHTFKEINYQPLNFEEINLVLKTPKTFTGIDEDTKKNITFLTKNWIEETYIKKGIEKSKEVNKCLLCKRELDEDVNALFKRYDDYFKNEESKFKDKLVSYQKLLESLKSTIISIDNSLQVQVDALCKTLDLKKQSWKKIDNSGLTENLKKLSEHVEKKIEHPDHDCSIFAEEGEALPFEAMIQSINLIIKANLGLIEKINKKIDNTGTQKAVLRTQIGKKLLYSFYLKNKSDFDSIIKLNQNIEVANQKLKEEQEKLPSKKASENIAGLCNIYLKNYLFIEKYKVEEDNGIIFLKLNDVDISTRMQKISEGEKTMIALAYFFSSSIKKFNSFDKFLKIKLIIDDPVCSMSYNHFFGVCSLIKYFDETIVKKLWVDSSNQLKQNPIQKIILTHNTQLFNVLRENTFKKKAEYYLLTSKEIIMVDERQLQSEFYTALYNIKRAVLKPDDPHVIGNDLRRFFETVRHFLGFKDAFNEETLPKVFEGFKEKEHSIFYNAVNYYSHGNPEAHTDPMPINFKPFLEQFDELIKESLFSDLWNKIDC